MDINDDYSFNYFINYIIKNLSGLTDAHTKYMNSKEEILPINIKYIENELYLLYPESLKGSKLISINDIEIDNIVKELDEIITYGTEGKRRYEIEISLLLKRQLFSIPSLKDKEQVIFKFEKPDGNIIEKSFNKEEKYERKFADNKVATYEIKDDTLIYYHGSLQLRYEEKINKSFEELAKLDLKNIQNIIVDIRGNTGGYSKLNQSLLNFLSKNTDKKLITLIDYQVFSGGRYALIDLIKLGSITVGEEISTPLNCYGNNNWIDIDGYSFSSSGSYLYPSVKGGISANSKEEFQEKITNDILIPVYFKPDIYVTNTKQDFLSNIDSIMNKALDLTKEKVKQK